MSNNSWSAKQYSAFENERTRPVRDLVAALPNPSVGLAVDLGCGPGNSTEVLASRYPDAKVTGMDSSEDMVQAARKRLPALDFELADIATWNPPQQYDVILANAALQWVPDHATLYPRLVGKLAQGGILAVQTPDNMEEPAHRLARQAVRRLFHVVGRLHGQDAALGQLADQTGVERRVVGHPLQRRVRQDHVVLLRRVPGGDVGQFEVQRGQALAGGLDHVFRTVHAGDFRVGIAAGQHLGGIARAAAQVHGQADGRIGQRGHQIAHRPGAFVFKSGILLGGPTVVAHDGSLPDDCVRLDSTPGVSILQIFG